MGCGDRLAQAPQEGPPSKPRAAACCGAGASAIARRAPLRRCTSSIGVRITWLLGGMSAADIMETAVLPGGYNGHGSRGGRVQECKAGRGDKVTRARDRAGKKRWRQPPICCSSAPQAAAPGLAPPPPPARRGAARGQAGTFGRTALRGSAVKCACCPLQQLVAHHTLPQHEAEISPHLLRGHLGGRRLGQ